MECVTFNPVRAKHFSCNMSGGGGGAEPVNLQFLPLDTNNRNQTWHVVGYIFEDFIC